MCSCPCKTNHKRHISKLSPTSAVQLPATDSYSSFMGNFNVVIRNTTRSLYMKFDLKFGLSLMLIPSYIISIYYSKENLIHTHFPVHNYSFPNHICICLDSERLWAIWILCSLALCKQTRIFQTTQSVTPLNVQRYIMCMNLIIFCIFLYIFPDL